MGFVIFMAVIVSVCVFACLIQGNGDKEEQSMETPILLGNHNDCKIDKGRYIENRRKHKWLIHYLISISNMNYRI